MNKDAKQPQNISRTASILITPVNYGRNFSLMTCNYPNCGEPAQWHIAITDESDAEYVEYRCGRNHHEFFSTFISDTTE